MNDVHYGAKRSFWLLRAFGGALLAAVSANFLRAGFGSVAGWFGLLGVAFFGAAAIVGFIQGTRRGPRLTLDAHGLHDRTLGVGIIPWSDIAGAGLYWVAKQPFIALHVRDAATYIARASGFKRLLLRLNGVGGSGPLSVNLAGLDADPEQVVMLIDTMRRRSRPIGREALRGFEDEDDPDDDDEPAPPSAERIALRALVLAAVVARSEIESEGRPDDGLRQQSDILHWLDTVGASAECEPRERRLLEAAIGDLTPAEVVNASWEAEGMAVLSWALGRSELPPFDRPCDPSAVAETVGFLDPPDEAAWTDASLRAMDEIEALGNQLFTVHWRLREFSLRPTSIDFRAVAQRTTFGLDPEGLPLADGDLAIDGIPLARVPEDRWRQCLSIAAERHRAVNWLMGFERVYSEVTADT